MTFLEFLAVVSIMVVIMGSFMGLFIFVFNRFDNRMNNLEQRIIHLEQGQRDIIKILKDHFKIA